jgi:hypothetical protein
MTDLGSMLRKLQDPGPIRRKSYFNPRIFTVSFDLDENPYNVSHLASFENELYSRYDLVVDIFEIRSGCIEVDYVTEHENDVVKLCRSIWKGYFDDIVIRFRISFVQFASSICQDRIYFVTKDK